MDYNGCDGKTVLEGERLTEGTEKTEFTRRDEETEDEQSGTVWSVRRSFSVPLLLL